MEIPFTNIRITQNTDKISEITPLFDKAIQEYKQLIKICSDDEFFKLKDEVLDIISQHKISVTKQNLINYFDKLYKDVDKIIRTNINFIDINKVKKELINKRILEKIDNETELFTHYNDEMYKVNDDVKEHFFVEIDKIKHVANMMAQSKHFSIENDMPFLTQKEKKDVYNDILTEKKKTLLPIKYTDNISSYICNCSDLLEIVNNGYRLFLLEHKENIYNYFFVLYLQDYINKELNDKLITPPNEKTELIQAFKKELIYNNIMEKLVVKNICQKDTYIVNDIRKRGKAYIISLLKYFHTKGYYIDNKELTNKEIMNISQNTFGVKISISYIKQCDPNFIQFEKLFD